MSIILIISTFPNLEIIITINIIIITCESEK